MMSRRVRSATCALAFLAVFAVGCEIRQDVTMSFNPDSSGQMSFSILFDDVVLEIIGRDAILDAMEDVTAWGWSTSEVQESGLFGFTATASFEDQAEFNFLADALLVSEVALLSELSYSVVDDVATFRSVFPVEAATGGVLDFVLTMVVEMPGEIQTSSAGTVDGSRVTWTLSSRESLSSVERLTVTSNIGGSAFGGLWLLLAVGALLLPGIVFYATRDPVFGQRSDPDYGPVASGQDLVKDFIAGTTDPARVPSEEKQSKRSLRAFCASCGTRLQVADRFCSSCGASTTPTTHHDTEQHL